MSPFKTGDTVISSTKIRQALMAGDMPTANKYLGYTYSITANVVGGLKLGSTELGYPTANLEVDYRYKLIPADGIYAVYANYEGKKYGGMMSIGMNPTMKVREEVWKYTYSSSTKIFTINLCRYRFIRRYVMS